MAETLMAKACSAQNVLHDSHIANSTCQLGDSVLMAPRWAHAQTVQGTPCTPERPDQLVAWPCCNNMFSVDVEKKMQLPVKQGSLEATVSLSLDQGLLQGVCQSLLQSEVCYIPYCR